jgi:hypothetical protein
MEDLNKFWTEDFTILYRNNNYLEFFPTNNMTKIQKLNSITRYSIYILPILYILSENSVWLLIPIIIIILCVFFYNIEKIDKSPKNLKKNKIKRKKIIENLGIPEIKNCQKPTNNNPYMNINTSDINKKPEKIKSCDINDDEIKKDVLEKFNQNLYRNVGDLYGRHTSERQFYTLPVTTIPNNQKGFAEWLYKTDDNCKYNGVNCLKYSDERYH